MHTATDRHYKNANEYLKMIPVPKKPYGFCGRKAAWNKEHMIIDG